MSKLCWIGFHKWADYVFEHSHVEGPHVLQSCETCGILRRKK